MRTQIWFTGVVSSERSQFGFWLPKDFSGWTQQSHDQCGQRYQPADQVYECSSGSGSRGNVQETLDILKLRNTFEYAWRGNLGVGVMVAIE